MERKAKIKRTEHRKEVIQNVLCYHSHFGSIVDRMSTPVLMAHTHPSFRDFMNRKNDKKLWMSKS